MPLNKETKTQQILRMVIVIISSDYLAQYL